jgi:hypothetical protein
MGTMGEERELRAELERARTRLAERRATIPAHTVRVHQIAELEDLEDRVRELEKRLAAVDPG